jgi:hypothetical protein
LPLHPGWPQRQSMSDVVSIASHWALQYLSELVVQVHGG